MSAAAGGVVRATEAVAVALCLHARVVLPLARRQAGRRVRRRAERLLEVGPTAPRERTALFRSLGSRVGRTVSVGPVGPWVVLSAVLLTGWFLVGGLAGWAVGLASAYGARRWQRHRLGHASRLAAEARARTAEAVRQLPMAADLLAACLSAGAGPVEAAEAVGDSLSGPVGDQLVRTAAEIRLGGDPTAAWGRLGGIPGAAALAGCLDRAASTGAPAAEPVARIAEALRAERARAAVARAQRAAVMVTAPVGLCFLPAFLAVGVAPVVIGLAGGLLQPA